MSDYYFDNQLFLQTEQEDDFNRKMNLITISLLNAIRSGNKVQLHQYIQTLLDFNIADYVSGDLAITKLYLAAYFSEQLEALRSFGLPMNIASIVKKSAFQKLASAKSEAEIRQVSSQFFQELFSLYQRYTISGYSAPVRLAIEQIHNLKMQPVSAGTIARNLNINRTYLSKIFRQETGMTMTDYIHSVKMDLAESLIAGRNFSLHEISDLLGYESYSYFSKVFKKQKGVLPSKIQKPPEL